MAAGHSPMEQFEIRRIVPLELGPIDAAITNSALFMAAAVILVTLFMVMAMRPKALVPGRMQSMAELSYEFIANMIKENVGTAGMKYFPLIFTLFMFILFLNLLGLLPYSFTVTSHIAVTFTLAFGVFLGVTLLAIAKHGLHFFSYFLPKGLPLVLAPLIIVIEVISYMMRPISLSVRLFANMLAGHTMLKVFAGFVVALGIAGGWLPFAFIVALTGLELLVAVLQAYVFTILTCIYLNDAIHLHH
ncbi:F0F1 ATP synthase subunit A [Zavarzinia sp. CC-PAN008]|uniref:F0F1 ATP synthase subunit A n=1 Tax=Zavarzinia sp. CC-PAN008 TaxID=3243332 RepID=UPI003F742D4E